MRRRRGLAAKTALATLLLLVGGACDDEHTVRYVVRLSLIENLEATPGTLSFLGSADRSLGRRELVGSVAISARDRTILVAYPRVKVRDSGGCLRHSVYAMIGPAPLPPPRTRVDLPPLTAGLWSLTFSADDRTSQGQLLVTDSSWAISGIAAEPVMIRTPALQRMPRDAVWGYVEGTSDSLARELRDSVIALGGSGGFRAGNFGRFAVDSNGVVLVTPTWTLEENFSYHDFSGFPGFALHFAGDTSQLQALARRFQAAHAGGVDAEILSATSDTLPKPLSFHRRPPS